MRKLIALALLALAVPLWAGYRNNTVLVTEASQTLPFTDNDSGASIRPRTIEVINDGANEVYVKEWRDDQTPAAATPTNGFRLEPGEHHTWVYVPPRVPAADSGYRGYRAVSVVCSPGETATARVEAQ